MTASSSASQPTATVTAMSVAMSSSCTTGATNLSQKNNRWDDWLCKGQRRLVTVDAMDLELRAKLNAALKNSDVDSAWGPWQTEVPPVGVPFMLNTYSSEPETRPKAGFCVYVIDRIDGRTLYLTHHATGTDSWCGGHSWSLDDKPEFRVLRSMSRGTSSEGCVCKRCNARNQFAQPNRPNGEYVCFECR